MIKKWCLICGISLFLVPTIHAQVYLAKNATVRIFSAAPLENIEAKSGNASCAFNVKTNKILFKVSVKSLRFESALMEEHFNENYLETEKFPYAEFEGIIVDLPDLTKNGEYLIKVKGRLTVHGVSKDRELTATLLVKDGDLTGKSVFKVKCVDHKIDIPKLVLKNIAEEIEVTINAEFKMIKK